MGYLQILGHLFGQHFPPQKPLTVLKNRCISYVHDRPGFRENVLAEVVESQSWKHGKRILDQSLTLD